MSSLVDAVAGLVELPVLAGRSITEWHDAVEEVFALRKERDRQNLEEAERALPHKLPMPSSSSAQHHIQRNQSLPSLRPTHHPPIHRSASDRPTTPPTCDPMFPFHTAHYIPGFPQLDLPSPLFAVTDTLGQLPSPGSTPEPFAEQDGVALAAEMGNPLAVNIIAHHYRQTGVYGISN